MTTDDDLEPNELLDEAYLSTHEIDDAGELKSIDFSAHRLTDEQLEALEALERAGADPDPELERGTYGGKPFVEEPEPDPAPEAEYADAGPDPEPEQDPNAPRPEHPMLTECKKLGEELARLGVPWGFGVSVNVGEMGPEVYAEAAANVMLAKGIMTFDEWETALYSVMFVKLQRVLEAVRAQRKSGLVLPNAQQSPAVRQALAKMTGFPGVGREQTRGQKPPRRLRD